MRLDYDKFKERNTEVVVVGPENAWAFKKYFEMRDLPFIGLPDPNHKVLEKYGQEVNFFKLGRMPAQALIDQKGLLRYVHYGHRMSDIPANDEMLPLLDELA